MAFAQLEDWGGRIELSFFRDTFLEFGAMLTRDAFLVAEGGLAYDEFAGGLRIRVKRLMTLNEAIERHARAFHLTLNGVDANFSASLQKVLAGYRGGRTPLRLSYGNSIATADIDLGNEWRVRATSDLKRELEKLPGVKSAELILNKPSLNAESDRAA
jgi:DNA polymerase-3 subunit alpha